MTEFDEMKKMEDIRSAIINGFNFVNAGTGDNIRLHAHNRKITAYKVGDNLIRIDVVKEGESE